MTAILVTNCDDWEALYIDGECVAQDHKLGRDHFVGLKSYQTVEVSSEYTYDVGYLPEQYSDIPQEAFL